MRRTSLSTGDLARYCQVTPATIVNWIRVGKLDVYTTPGGQYRMELPKFMDFLKKSGFPLPEELREDREVRVLVVDSNAQSMDKLTHQISRIGRNYKVQGMSYGVDALVRLGQFKPHVFVMDVKYPGLDGVEVARRLRMNPATKNIRVVVVTGAGRSSEDVRKIKRTGVEAVFFKPADPNKVAEAVEQAARV